MIVQMWVTDKLSGHEYRSTMYSPMELRKACKLFRAGLLVPGFGVHYEARPVDPASRCRWLREVQPQRSASKGAVMTVLRIYDPEECDANGDPLDWERCRGCDGVGYYPGGQGEYFPTNPKGWMICEYCDGHGSLKAAALAKLWKGRELGLGTHHGAWHVHRCESCQHPMSEGTWEGDRPPLPDHTDAVFFRDALAWLTIEHEEPALYRTYYSPCDEKCEHGGPGRYMEPPRLSPRPFWRHWSPTSVGGQAAVMVGLDNRVEASWRQVEVRRMGWPMDLRPEKLKVLCLRCFAEVKNC